MSVSELEDDIRILRRKQTKCRSLKQMKRYNVEITMKERELSRKLANREVVV